MKIWQIIIISIFVMNTNIYSQEMAKYEDSLITLLEKVHFSKNLDSAMKFNMSFKKTLKR